MQQKCSEKIILWLLFPPARGSLAAKCFEDSACPPELIWYASLRRRSGSYSFLCSPCMLIKLFSTTQPSPTFISSLLFSQGFIILILHIFDKNLSSNWLILIQVMQELGLIGLRIQRMPSEPGLEFGIPSQYSYMTVRSCACFIVVQLVISRMGFYRFIFWCSILKWFIIL